MNKISITLSAVICIFSANAFSDCSKYYSGEIGEKYPITFSEPAFSDDDGFVITEYIYHSQLFKGNNAYINLRKDEGVLREYINEYLPNVITFNKPDSSDIKKGEWKNERTGTTLSITLKKAVDYVPVSQEKITNHTFTFYKKHHRLLYSYLGLSIDGSDVIPIQEDLCEYRFDLPNIARVQGSESLFLIKVTGEQRGTGNWSRSRFILIDARLSKPVLAILNSGSGGGPNLSGRGDISVKFNEQLEIIIYKKSLDDSDVEHVRTTYFYNYDNGIGELTRINRKLDGWQFEPISELELNIPENKLDLLPEDDSIVKILSK